jgi:hypothetical protein
MLQHRALRRIRVPCGNGLVDAAMRDMRRFRRAARLDRDGAWSTALPSYHRTATALAGIMKNGSSGAGTATSGVRVVVEAGDQLGESPVWDDRAAALW